MHKFRLFALLPVFFAVPAFGQNGIAAVTPGIVSNYAGYLAATANKGCTIGTTAASAPYDGCPPANIQLEGLAQLIFDANGNLYLADNNDHRIRKITPAGVVSTVIGNATYNNTVGATPSQVGDNGLGTAAVMTDSNGLAVDSAGNVYYADYRQNRVRILYEGGTVAANLIGLENPGVVAQVGYIYTIAGNGSFPSSTAPTLTDAGVGDGGMASAAMFGNSANVQSSNGLNGLAVDSAGNVYISDGTNDIVRVVNASTGIITLFAGVFGSSSTYTNGVAATASSLGVVRGLAVNAAGDVFIDGGDIYMVNGPNTTATTPGLGYGYAPGIIHNVTGGGSNSFAGPYNQLATLTHLGSARQITLDAAGDIYNNDNNYIRIAKTDVNDVFTLVAGNAAQYTGQAAVVPPVGLTGPATALQGGALLEAAINPLNGNLYVGDQYGGSLSTSAETYSAVYIVSASAGALAFGNQPTYIPSASQLAIVSNVSSGTLHLSGVAFSASTPFAQVPSGKTDCTPSTVLAPGYSCYIAVQFTPTALGPVTGTLTITDDSTGVAGSTQTFALSGTGTAPATATTLTASPSPASAASTITLTAKVAPTSGSPIAFPTGTMTFLSSGTSIGTGTLNAAGVATLATTLPAGSYTLSATYPGDTVYALSASANVSLTVASTALTATALAVSSQTIVVGGSETLTATVTSPSGTPTGTVQFYNGTATLGSPVTLAGGVASYTTATLAAGYNPISAVFVANATYTTSTSVTIGVQVAASSYPVAALIPGIVTLFAGTSGTPGLTGDGGAESAALLNSPTHAAFDASGNLYLADTGNNTIRKVAATSGTIAASSTISVLAGAEGVAGAAVGSAASAARFQSPQGIAFDPSGNLYVADSLNNVVKKVAASSGTISSSSTVSSFAGSQVGLSTDTGGAFTAGYSGDGGAPLNATLNDPRDLAIDKLGNIFIADYGNNVVRMINGASTTATTPGLGYGYAANVIHTVAGSGRVTSSSYPMGDGGAATSATFNKIGGIAVDLNGNLYISDQGNYVVRKVTASTGTIATYAGTAGTAGYAGDGGAATSAKLLSPAGLSVDVAGDLYISDSANSAVREVTPAGTILTVAGTGVSGATGNNGPSTSAQFYAPVAAVPDGLGNLYVVDSTAHTVRQINGQASMLNFPEEIVNTTSAPLSVLVSNVGGQTLSLSALAISSPVFTQTTTGTGNCTSTSTIAPGASCTVTVTAGSASGGTNTGTLSFTDNSYNSATSKQTAALSIVTAVVYNQTITFPAVGPLTYGTAPITLTATATSNLPVSYTVVSGPGSISGSVLTVTGAGSIVVTASQPGQQFAYYAAPNVTQTIVVNKAPLTFTATSFSQAYGIAIGTLNYTVAGYVNGDTASTAYTGTPSVTTTATSSSPAGSYPIVVSTGSLVSAKYSFAFVNGTLLLAGQPQFITFNAPPAATYSATPVALTATSTSGLTVVFTVVSGPATVSGNLLTTTGAGTVTIQASQPGNYNATTNPNGYGAAIVVYQSLTVNPAPLTVTPNSYTRAYAAANPTLTGTIVGAVGANVITAAYSTTATVNSPAGTYPITATVSSSNTSLSNYNITLATGTLTVTQLTPSIALTASLTSVNPSNPEVLTAVVSSPVGAAPTGTVSFYDGTTLIGTPVALTAGTAKLTTYGLQGGTQNVTAVYNGDVNYVTVTSSSVGPISVQIKSYVTLATSASTADLGSPVTFTATVSPISPSNATPTGSVTFFNGTTAIGTANLAASGGNGVATLTVSNLPLTSELAYPTATTTKNYSATYSTSAAPVPLSITAVYSGDSFFVTSTSSAVSQTITPDFSLYLLTASPTTGTVTASNEGTVSNSGSVTTFSSYGSVTVTDGQTAQVQGYLVGYSNYSNPVTFSCSGLPQYATCSFSQSTLAPTTVGNIFNVTINALGQRIAPASNASLHPGGPRLFERGGLALAALLVGAGGVFRRRKAVRGLLRRGGLLLIALGLFAGTAAISGCGNAQTAQVPYLPVPPGSSVVTVTAQNGDATYNSTFTLVVVP